MMRIQSAIITSAFLGVILVLLTISLISPGENVSAGTQNSSSTQPEPSTGHPEIVGSLPANSSQPQTSVSLVPEEFGTSDECNLSQQYPETILQWCSLILNAADEHGLDANLIAAVMLQESGGNPEAYSKSGAVGLLQVMPKDGIAATFQCMNGPCFANRPSSAELFDPRFNIQYGTRMLAGLMNRYGNIRDALMAYGPMDVGYYYADKVMAIYQNYK